MTIRSLLLAASVAALLAGCAKEDDSPQEGAGGTTTVPAGATGTMNVSLKYAIETRADQEYDDGEDSESRAQDLTIYFFDDDKNYLGSSYVSDLSQEDDSKDYNVTSTITVDVPTNIVQTLYESSDKEATMYVVAVLNKGTFTPQITAGENYNVFNAACQIALADAAKTDNFMMTSSNYLKDISGTQQTEMALTPITKEYVGLKSDDKATAPRTVTIAVERVVAKVTVQDTETRPTDGATWTILGWGLNVTNKTFYPVKNFGGNQFLDLLESKYNTWQPNTINKPWNNPTDMRSHWAVDPNYAAGQATITDMPNDFNEFSFSDPSSAEVKGALYCFENTTVETMQQRNATTSAVIVAQFYPKDFKETDKDDSWIKWNDAAYSGDNSYAAFVEAVVKEVDGDNQAITTYYKEDVNGTTTDDGKKYSPLSEEDFICTYTTEGKEKITFGKKNTTIGYKDAELQVALKDSEIKLYTITDGQASEASKAPAKINEAIKNALTDNPPTVYYKGYCYYVVPIRHFAKDEVADYTGGEYQPNHLGRYGIVRNNYYQITINDITQPGEPITDPTVEPSTDKDDETNYWINVSIKVLSWKIRTQDVIL